LVVVVGAVFKIGSRALKNWAMVTLAALAFVAIFFFDVAFPLIVIAAALIGFLGGRVAPGLFHVLKGHATGREDERAVITDEVGGRVRPSTRRLLGVVALWGSLWFIPLVTLVVLLGRDHPFVEIGVFFSKAAVVTFGGAYAVLAYIAQEAVGTYGWLRPGEMLDGLGMAETTPGPLIQVVQFVGFMGAYRDAGSLSPLMAGVLGSVITTWVTFVPCFLWIFAGAPYIEYLRGNKSVTTALSGITAAVVGVVLNLALWFALNVLFGTVEEMRFGALRLYTPDLGTLDLASLFIAAAAFIALFRYRLGMIATLALSAGVGLVYYLAFRA
jgi:chromate transporter